MSRLADIREQDATGKAADIFAGIKKAMGKVPNAYLTIGGHSPAALQQALAHNAMLHKSSLSAQELEAINLSVSEATGCDYCLAAHTLMAKKTGFSGEQIHALRRGEIRTLADWRIRPVRSYTHADQEVYAQLTARERMAANLLLTAA